MATSAERKYDALIFWDNHGLPATQDAFGVSRSTLYAWRKRHREGGLSGLHDVSKAPKSRRVRRGIVPSPDGAPRQGNAPTGVPEVSSCVGVGQPPRQQSRRSL